MVVSSLPDIKGGAEPDTPLALSVAATPGAIALRCSYTDSHTMSKAVTYTEMVTAPARH